MSCTNPSLLLALDIRSKVYGQRLELEKRGFKFNEDQTKAYKFVASNSRNIPLENVSDWQDMKLLELPCGSCLNCRIQNSHDWAIRCTFEAKLWKYNYFVTLTYDDDYLPEGKHGNPTLSKEDIGDFIKTLRNYFRVHLGHTGIRYLLCGEYNSSGVRILNPHYHMILFNCPIPDLCFDFPSPSGGIIHKLNKLRLPMMFSKIINDIWGKGYICIDDANFNTEAYVSQYIMKKQKGENGDVYYNGLGVLPPFIRMSNRPGLGFNFFLQDMDKYALDPFVIIPRANKPCVKGIPKYFKRKLFEKDSSLRDVFEERAKDNEARMRSVRAAYNTTSNQQKAYEEVHRQSVTKIFSRNFE